MAIAADPVECETLRVTNPARYQRDCAKPRPKPAASQPARPPASAAAAGIAPGRYRCRLGPSAFQECTVAAQGRRTTLSFDSPLMAFAGELAVQRGALAFTGQITGANPEVCGLNCDFDGLRKAGHPTETRVGGTYYGGTCVPTASEALPACRAQPLRMTLRRSGRGWSGRMALVRYSNRVEPARPTYVTITGWQTFPDSYDFTIQP